MPILIDQNGPDHDISREIEKTAALLVDLQRFANREFPTRSELEAAPLIDQYQITPRLAYSLVGVVSDHPRLGTGTVTTTELWAIAPRLGWARTWSRFYRLGSPLES